MGFTERDETDDVQILKIDEVLLDALQYHQRD